MMCSARAFFLLIFSTAKSWLKWFLVNLESTVSRSCVRSSAGETILRFRSDDVFSKSVLSPDFQHGKELVEMVLGEFGINGEPELRALLCGRNDSALQI